MMVLGLAPMIKRLSTTLVVSFGMTSSSASMVSDSLPVCSIERLPTPLSSTSPKPLTFLDSFATLAGSFVLPLGFWPLCLAADETCEEDESPTPRDVDDEAVTEV